MVSLSKLELVSMNPILRLIIRRSQILNIKDLRRTDTGNFTCEVFNSFGTINTSYVLVVTGTGKWILDSERIFWMFSFHWY